MKDARGRARTCQEVVQDAPYPGACPNCWPDVDGREDLGRDPACPDHGVVVVVCGAPAAAVVDSGDDQPYWMCAACADHCVRNRGGVRLYPRMKGEGR